MKARAKKKIAVAVIPARGGSVGIPRKNARLMGEKPLLAYSIENARAARRVDKIYVSTDDPELAEIAKRYGAHVLQRPAALADAETTLDSVIVHAAHQLDIAKERYDILVTLQATSPLLKPKSIDLAIEKCHVENLDTVISVVNTPHLAWTKDDTGKIVPLYETRLNRQSLPPYYRETGGIVVAQRETIQLGSRFGQYIGIIEVEKTESIDIDDYFDWWQVANALSRKTICFHVIGNHLCGLGHTYRALTLADRLIDHDLWFLVNEDNRLAEDIIRKRFYPVRSIPPGSELSIILSEKPDLLINDILDTDEAFISAVKNAGIATINFEDVGPGSLKADYVINAMYDDHPQRKDSHIYHGVEYCCLRDEFFSVPAIKSKKSVRNILLLFGGTDPNNLTGKCLKWLDGISGNWSVTVVMGLGYQYAHRIQQFAARAKHPVEIVHDTSIISRYMTQADVVVTSAGRTVFEVAGLGVPMIVICQNERELHHSFAQQSTGIIHLGLAEKLKKPIFVEAVTQVVFSHLLREHMHNTLVSIDIRKGVDKVCGIISNALKIGAK